MFRILQIIISIDCLIGCSFFITSFGFLRFQVICPYNSGEVAIQSYNSILTLSHIYHHSDMIVLQENSNLLKICQKRLNIKKPSLVDLNEVACHCFCSMVLPCEHLGSTMSLGTFLILIIYSIILSRFDGAGCFEIYT